MSYAKAQLSGWLSKLKSQSIVVVLAIAFFIYFCTIAFSYLNMFLLVEYRQWVFNANFHELLSYFDSSRLIDQIASSRSLSMRLALLFGTACGPSPVCNNSIHLVLVLTAACLSALTVWRLSSSRSWFPALVTGVVILFSIPVLDALTWQATLHDKLAMLFSAATLFVVASTRVEPTSGRNTLIANGLIFLPMAAAYNCKEAAFFLAPAAVMLMGCRVLMSGATAPQAVRRTAALIGLPALYACAHVALVLYSRIVLTPGEFHRVTGGNLPFNAEYYTRYMLDLQGSGFPLREVVAGGLILTAGLVGAAATAAIRGRRGSAVLVIWGIVGLAGSVMIPLQTSATSPFYLLAPMVYFGLMIGLGVEAVLAVLPTAAARNGFILACVVALGLRLTTLAAALPGFTHLVDLSAHFERTLDILRADMAAGRPRRLVFIRPHDEPRDYMFVSSPGDVGAHALSPYLLPKDASPDELAKFDLAIVDVPETQASASRKPGDLRVFLGPLLQIDHVERVPD